MGGDKEGAEEGFVSVSVSAFAPVFNFVVTVVVRPSSVDRCEGDGDGDGEDSGEGECFGEGKHAVCFSSKAWVKERQTRKKNRLKGANSADQRLDM